MHRAVEQAFEDPEQVIRRHAEHRRAQAAERIERDDGAVRRELVREAVDQMNLGGRRPIPIPPGCLRTRLDDELGRAADVGGLHDVERALRDAR